MYDDYINSTGYINESRVKLLTMDTDGNPYGVLDIFKTANTDSKIVVEDYYTGSQRFERVSKIATAGPNHWWCKPYARKYKT